MTMMRYPTRRQHYRPLPIASLLLASVITIILGCCIPRISCFSPLLLRPLLSPSSSSSPSAVGSSSVGLLSDHHGPESTITTTATTTFDDLGLDPRVARVVRAQPDDAWDRPTPVQQYAIPQLVLSNNHNTTASVVWCEAPTGSGKTAAYVLPLLHHQLLQHQHPHNHNKQLPQQSNKISALILCPTRELVQQIARVVQQLASAVATDSSSSSKKKKWRIVALYGGVPRAPQLAQLVANDDKNHNHDIVDVVVATPGRLVDVLTYYSHNRTRNAADDVLEEQLLAALDRKNSLSLEDITKLQLQGRAPKEAQARRASLSNFLHQLDYLILDEADRLLGRGFEIEMQAVLDLLPQTASSSTSVSRMQTWLFSATFPKALEPRMNAMLQQIHPQLQSAVAAVVDQDNTNKDDHSDNTASMLPHVVRISCSQSDRVHQERISSSLSKKLEHVTTPSRVVEQIGPASTITQTVYRVQKRDRTPALRYLLSNNDHDNTNWDRVLVFVASRYASEHVSRKLRRAGFTATAELHGKLDQNARERRLRDFAKSSSDNKMPRVLIATDVAARGLDISGLPCVIHYDLPRSTVDFVHRCGRTGRAGRPGTVVTLLTPQDEAHFSLMEERHLVEPVPRQTLDPFPIDPDEWLMAAEASRQVLAHDRMHGGIKGRRQSKKDKLREAQAAAAAQQQT